MGVESQEKVWREERRAEGEGFVCWWVFAGYVNFEEAGFFEEVCELDVDG
jgi:hypothetical protein